MKQKAPISVVAPTGAVNPTQPKRRQTRNLILNIPAMEAKITGHVWSVRELLEAA
jgi:hypothetical protein